MQDAPTATFPYWVVLFGELQSWLVPLGTPGAKTPTPLHPPQATQLVQAHQKMDDGDDVDADDGTNKNAQMTLPLTHRSHYLEASR